MHNRIRLLVVLLIATTATIAPTAANADSTALDSLTGSDSPVIVGRVDQNAVRDILRSLDTTIRSSPGTYDRPSQYGTWSTKTGSADDAFCGTTREDIRNRDLADVRYTSDDPCEVEHGVLKNDPESPRN